MRLGLPKRKDETIDPRRPHEYRSKTDPGIAAMTGTGGGLGRQGADLASVSMYTRTMGCSVPGCGQPRDALVHAPED